MYRTSCLVGVAAVLLATACARSPDLRAGEGDRFAAPTAAEGPTSTVSGVSAQPRPAGFDYPLKTGGRTFDPDRGYFDSEMLGDALLANRFLTSDAVVVVDVKKVGEASLNSADQVWWSPPHSEDSSLIRPAVGIDVEVEVVGVLKARERTTTFGLRSDAPDLSRVGSPHPAREVPGVPGIGERLTIWVQGGIAKVTATAEEWSKYLKDWSPGPRDHVHDDEPPATGEPIPPVFELEVGGRPNMDLAEGGRYVVFLRALEVPQRDGSVRHVWTGDYDTARSQLLVDPKSQTFVEPGGQLTVTAEELGAALESAAQDDAEPGAYRPDELDRMFG